MATVVKAAPVVYEMLDKILPNHKRLEGSKIGICFADTKPFKGGRINLGKASKFSPAAKIWQDKKYDFCITLCADLWYQVLKEEQREALLDLMVTCCDVEYEPMTQNINGKDVVIKDDWGRVRNSDKIKVDDEGNPKWKVNPLGIDIYTSNIRRYGLWYEDLESLSEAMKDKAE